MKKEFVLRKINYFEIRPTFFEGKANQDLISIFYDIKEQYSTKNRNRFFLLGDKMLYIASLSFLSDRQCITGKLLNIRMDLFPELMDTSNDVIRDIDAAESEGIVETSHFILSYKNEEILLALEFNQYGPRISDFIGYILNKGTALQVLEKLDFLPLQRDDLLKYKQRINSISLVTAKVHKDNWRRIQEFDQELFDAFHTCSKVSDAEYVTMVFSFDYRDNRGSMNMRSKIMNIIDKFIGDKTSLNVFNTLKVNAQDEERNNRIKEFDLLNIWVKSELRIEKKPKSRSIVSADIFDKMKQEFYKEFAR